MRFLALLSSGVILALPVAMLVRQARAEEAKTVNIPVDCGQHVCVMPKAVFAAVIESHNAAIDEVRKLKAELAGRGRACPGDRGV